MSEMDDRPPVGLWLIGGRGAVATTTIVGAALMEAGMAPTTGLVTATDDFSELGLAGPPHVVFGGHDVVETPLSKRAEELAGQGALPAEAVTAVEDHLAAVDDEILVAPSGEETHPARVVDRLAEDLRDFTSRHGLERTVVVDVSSTEPPVPAHPAHEDPDALRAALSRGEDVLPASSLYALAAFEAGCPFVGFTPSTGSRLPALDRIARRRGVAYAGADGKTGQTLLRTALAPTFAARNLRVRSWAGTNVLGGGDGATLADPDNAESKLASKQRVLGDLLGYTVDAPLHIDHVPDMGDWKTAWDHISFEGFLGVRMKMQVTWEGCDSALAAPLVLDLARLTDLAAAAGQRGPLGELAFFFKDPVGRVEPGGVEMQYATLTDWVRGIVASR